jgi:hypothetical protein
MANLSTEKTGVDGVIYISTSQGSPAARIKWYPGRPKDGAPCLSATIAAEPQAFNHNLPQRVFDAASMRVKAWSALNHVSLLDFWQNGTSWMDEEVDAYKKALKRLP